MQRTAYMVAPVHRFSSSFLSTFLYFFCRNFWGNQHLKIILKMSETTWWSEVHDRGLTEDTRVWNRKEEKANWKVLHSQAEHSQTMNRIFLNRTPHFMLIYMHYLIALKLTISRQNCNSNTSRCIYWFTASHTLHILNSHILRTECFFVFFNKAKHTKLWYR